MKKNLFTLGQKVTERFTVCLNNPPPKKAYICLPWVEVKFNFIWIPFRTVLLKSQVQFDQRPARTDNTGVITQTNLSSSPWSMFRLRVDKESLTHGRTDREAEMERGGFGRNSKGRWNDLAENKKGLCADAPRTQRRKHLCSDPSPAHMHRLLHIKGL